MSFNPNISMAMCHICNTKNELSFEETRLRNLKSRLEMLTSEADEENKRKAELILKNNPYIRNFCECYSHCKYGLHCSQLHHHKLVLNNLGQEIMEKIVLLSIIDKDKTKSFVNYFCGYYPKAAKFILSL